MRGKVYLVLEPVETKLLNPQDLCGPSAAMSLGLVCTGPFFNALAPMALWDVQKLLIREI